MIERINPDVQRLITPIMERMTAIHMAERNVPAIGNTNNDPYKREKQECVHFIFNGNQPECTLVKTQDGKLKCKVCDREIGTHFDNTAVQTLLEARKVVEQIMFFGMINNMKADCVAGCIDLKKILPELAQIIAQLNEYVKREEQNIDASNNIGEQYRFQGITASY